MITWTNDLNIGHDLIDEQHRELLDRTNKLLDSCKSGEGNKGAMDAIKFLDTYVKGHLRDEEQLMIKHDYPAMHEHKQQHVIFLEKVDAMKKSLETQGATLTNVMKTTNLFVDWLLKHIKREDKKLGDYLSTLN
jgi:hemerythrin